MPIADEQLEKNFVVVDGRTTVRGVRIALAGKDRWTYIVVKLDDGKYAVVWLAELIQALHRWQGTELQPSMLNSAIEGIPDFLQPLAGAAVEQDMLEIQAALDAASWIRNQRLVVLRNGKVVGLFGPEQTLSSEKLVLRSVVRVFGSVASRLPALSKIDLEWLDRPALYGSSRGTLGGTLSIDVPVAPDAPRVINAILYYDTGTEVVAADVSLALQQQYRLEVNIGHWQSNSRLASDVPGLPTPPVTDAGLDLLVTVTTGSDEITFEAPTQPLHLPSAGDSLSAVLFCTVTGVCADVPIWVHIYYRWNLLQTVELHVATSVREQTLAAPLPAKSVYTRVVDFVGLDKLRPNDVTLRLWGNDAGYRMSVAWPGDGTTGRRDPVRGLNIVLPVNKDALINAITEARNKLYDITWQPSYRQGVRGTLNERLDSLNDLATVGNLLYTTLFMPENATATQATSLTAFRQWLEDVLVVPADQVRPTLQIIHEQPPGGLPWGLLYPLGTQERTDVDANQFWGCRYRLEILTPQFARNAQATPPPAAMLRIVGGVYNFRVPGTTGVIEVTADHLQYLREWNARDEQIAIDLRDQADQTSLPVLLSEGDVVYMFCHGHTAKAPEDTVEWIARFRDALSKLPPAMRSGYADLLNFEQASYQPNDPNLSDSWLQWNNSLLPLRLLKQWQLKLDRKPLVLLNMCESAQVLPTLGTGFVPFFSQLGARGVLGTECPMLAPFAAAFGQALLERLRKGDRMGDILPELRKQFLEQERNPLGLAYTYYGEADLAFSLANGAGH